jgi:hypothetical protein
LISRKPTFIDVQGERYEKVVVHGYADSPAGPCECHLNRQSKRIEVSEFVPLDDRDLRVCEVIEQATGIKDVRLVPFVGSVRADGFSA